MSLADEIIVQLERIRDGWCDPEKGIAIADIIRKEELTNCVEIGVFAGKSLISAAIGLKHLNRGTITGIDSWSSADSLIDVSQADADWWAKNVNLEDIYSQFIANVAASGVSRFIRVLRMPSLEASKVVPGPIDFLHIDGTHSEWGSTTDVCVWLPKVRTGGVVLMDDVNWPSTQTAIKFVEKWCDKADVIQGKESVSSFFRKR